MMELGIARGLSSIHVLGHEGARGRGGDDAPLPLLAIAHPMLPWPIIIQTSITESELQLPTSSRGYRTLCKHLSA